MAIAATTMAMVAMIVMVLTAARVLHHVRKKSGSEFSAILLFFSCGIICSQGDR